MGLIALRGAAPNLASSEITEMLSLCRLHGVFGHLLLLGPNHCENKPQHSPTTLDAFVIECKCYASLGLFNIHRRMRSWSLQPLWGSEEWWCAG